MSTNNVHGLALKIRSSTESETFDLGGLSGDTIQSVIQDAFPTPFEDLSQMIRITLVIGAGKQARQKYDASALKVVTSTLTSLGFSEDRGASCSLDCQGLFKVQHDTGKNLKTVVVFPRVVTKGDTNEASSSTNTGESSPSGSLLVKNSMEDKVARSTLTVFQNMISSKCSTWSQKKALLQVIDDVVLQQVYDCDELLMTGKPLSDAQQAFYNSTRELSDKRDYISKELQAHVDRGDLTQGELDHLKSQLESRITSAQQEGGSKNVPEKLQERRQKLNAINPKELPKLQHHAALGKLWKQLAPLHHISEHSNQLRSLQETQLLGQKVDLLEQIETLEQASRGWLEEDDTFEARRQACRKTFQLQFGISGNSSGSKKKTSSGGGATVSASTKVKVPVNKWVTPTIGINKQSAQAKKKARLRKGDVFGAMMVTSDESDDDNDENVGDDDSEDAESQVDIHRSNTLPMSDATTKKDQSPSVAAKAASDNSENKKKKKKKKGRSNYDLDDLSPPAGTASQSNDESSPSSALATVQMIFQDYLIPFLLAILTWIVGTLFGKNKSNKSKKN